MPTYGQARAVVADLLEGCNVVDALSDLNFYESGLVPLPVIATDHAAPFFAAEVTPFWLYYCVSQSRDVSNRFMATPSARNRVLGAQLFVTGAHGFLHWGFNFYNSYLSRHRINPFRDTGAGGAFIAGDPFLVYPGPDGVPWESIRHRVTTEAFIDYRALRRLAAKDEEKSIKLADQNGTLRLDNFSYDADHYRQVLFQVATEIDAD